MWGPAISAVVALLVATLIFVWQREVEFTFHLRRERLETYRRFLAEIEALTFKLEELKRGTDQLYNLNSRCEEIRLIAKDNVSEPAIQVVSSFYDIICYNENPRQINLNGNRYEHVNEKKNSLVTEMKKDIENISYSCFSKLRKVLCA
jgi:hypothetical protein